MKMHIIGTGTATVSKYINTSCVFEEDNQLFLVDGTGGSDILRAFDIMNLDWKHLHHAFLSHEHTDHFLGMIWVIRTIAELLELEEYEGDFYLYGNDEVLGKALQVCRMILKKRSQVFLETRIKFVVVKDHEKRHILNYDFTFFNIGSTKAKQYGFLMEYDNGKKLVFAGDEPLKECVSISASDSKRSKYDCARFKSKESTDLAYRRSDRDKAKRTIQCRSQTIL